MKNVILSTALVSILFVGNSVLANTGTLAQKAALLVALTDSESVPLDPSVKKEIKSLIVGQKDTTAISFIAEFSCAPTQRAYANVECSLLIVNRDLRTTSATESSTRIHFSADVGGNRGSVIEIIDVEKAD